jgi:Fanconi anemia group M protein
VRIYDLLCAAKQDTIQAVFDNLQISCLEYRDENDLDVRQYTHHRELELIQVTEVAFADL